MLEDAIIPIVQMGKTERMIKGKEFMYTAA